MLLLSRFGRVPVPGILQARTLEWIAISFSNAWKWKVKVKSLSRARLFATPWAAAYQAPPSMGFSRQEYWSGLPLPSPHQSLRTSLISIHHIFSDLQFLILTWWVSPLMKEELLLAGTKDSARSLWNYHKGLGWVMTRWLGTPGLHFFFFLSTPREKVPGHPSEQSSKVLCS